MSHTRIGRRRFLQLMGMTAIASTTPATIARALEIPANNRTGTIQDVYSDPALGSLVALTS